VGIWLSLVILTLAYGALGGHAAVKPDTATDRQQYEYRLGVARTAYFKVITSNDEAASRQAHTALAELEQAYPGDPVAKAYHGSLELLDAAHSWAVWNLHKQAADGLTLLDEAVNQAPDEPEARFIRAATSWHLPGFYHRKAQCEADFALLAGRAEEDARRGRLPPELAAATYNYWGQILVNRGDIAGAQGAFRAALRVAPQSPGGVDAEKRLKGLR
jgi:tetratricopeptide (TPR) repeat protein